MDTSGQNNQFDSKTILRIYTHSDVRIAIDAIDVCTDHVISFIRDWTQQTHQIDRSHQYFRRVYGGFLLNFLPTVYDLVQFPRPCGVNDDSIDRATTSSVPEFNLQIRLSTQFQSQLRRDVLTASTSYSKLVRLPSPTRVQNQSVSFLDRLEQKASVFRPKIACFMLPMTRMDRLKLYASGRFQIGPVGPFSHSEVPVDQALRNSFHAACLDVQTESEFEMTVLRLIAAYLPMQLLEGFRDVQPQIEKSLNRYRPAVIVTGYGLIMNARFAIWASECAEQGTSIVGWQHGGVYGETDQTPSERLERNVCDRFMSWGWSDDKNDVIPLPSPRQFLAKPKPQKIVKHSSKVLWVTTADAKHVNQIMHYMFGGRWEDYFEFQTDLWNALPDKIQREVLVRLYKLDFGWNLRDRWQARCSDIQFARQDQTILEIADQCGLVLIDHFGGTTVLECITRNTPMMLVGNSKYFEIRPSAKAAYQALFDAGIAHDNVESAANELASCDGDYYSWWNGKSRQAAVKVFQENFAKLDYKYISKWKTALLEVSKA